MKDLEENYSENKENCEHLLSKKHSLVLAAKPLDFMEMFRFVCLFLSACQKNFIIIQKAILTECKLTVFSHNLVGWLSKAPT